MISVCNNTSDTHIQLEHMYIHVHLDHCLNAVTIHHQDKGMS